MRKKNQCPAKFYNSEGENERTVSQKRKASNMEKKVTPNSKRAAETPKSNFASIIPENIMLVYLRRSSIQELLENPETFTFNVLGSYVRIQSDPKDHSQKSSHQLLQVAGVKKAPGFCDEREGCIRLVVLPSSKEIPISMLSDEFFKKEECEDLYQRIIAGSVWRPTVMELQHKAQILHKVITKQWLAKEFSLMRSLIDRDNETGWCATEKGWRKELFEYLERTVLLQKPAGQKGLLLTVPNVIAEDLEPEFTVQNPAEDGKNDICCSPILTIAGTSGEDPEPEFTFQKSAEEEKNDISCSPKLTFVATSTAEQKEILLPVPNVIAEDLEPESIVQKSAEEKKNDICCSPILTIAGTSAAAVIDEGNTTNTFVKEANGVANKSKEPEIIEISDDDDQQGVDDPNIAQWYYEDVNKVMQGPVQAKSLKKWKAEGYFMPGFKVWKIGQPPVLLDDMLSQMFPN